MTDRQDYSLLGHNTFGIDVRCRRYIEFADDDEATETAQILRTEKMPFIIIGKGSNLLLTHDFDGIVVRSAIEGCDITTATQTKATTATFKIGSGVEWDDFVQQSIDAGWYGAENLTAIPGDVGASAVQNIGAYGAEVCQIIDHIEAVCIADSSRRSFTADECDYAYRQSNFKTIWHNQYLITAVHYRLSSIFHPNISYGNLKDRLQNAGISNPTPQQVRDIIRQVRDEKLPDYHREGNAGSFFKNPIVSRQTFDTLKAEFSTIPHYLLADGQVKIPAAWLIEQCGWKGRQMGRAAVSEKHPLILVNKGGAEGSEIAALCKAVQEDVKSKFGILLSPEVNIV